MRLATDVPNGPSRQVELGARLNGVATPNDELRELVDASGLSPAVAMTIFNRTLGSSACTETEWRAYLAEPGTARYRELSGEQLAHAVFQFARIGVHRSQYPSPSA